MANDSNGFCSRPVLRILAASPAPTAPAPAPQEVERHIHPPFFLGEEVPNDSGLADSKGILIDDVLETSEWCVSLDTGKCCSPSRSQASNQGGHTRVTKGHTFMVQEEYIIVDKSPWPFEAASFVSRDLLRGS